MKNLYSPYFRQIVFYGEVANATLGIQAVNLKGGLLWHAALRHAMMTHVLNRTGYLFMNDDVLLNIRVARQLDFDKIWVASKETEMVDVRRASVPQSLERECGNTRTREPNAAWKKETGFIASQLTIKYLDDRSWFTGHMRSMLQNNARARVTANRISVEKRFQDPYNETMFHFSPNELVFIPSKIISMFLLKNEMLTYTFYTVHLRKQFVRLCNVFIENHVVHTIARKSKQYDFGFSVCFFKFGGFSSDDRAIVGTGEFVRDARICRSDKRKQRQLAERMARRLDDVPSPCQLHFEPRQRDRKEAHHWRQQ